MTVKELNNLVNASRGGLIDFIFSKAEDGPILAFKNFILAFIFCLDVIQAMPVFAIGLNSQLVKRESEVENATGKWILKFINNTPGVKSIYKNLLNRRWFSSKGGHTGELLPTRNRAKFAVVVWGYLAWQAVKRFAAKLTSKLNPGELAAFHRTMLSVAVLEFALFDKERLATSQAYALDSVSIGMFSTKSVIAIMRAELTTTLVEFFVLDRKFFIAMGTDTSRHRNLSCLRLSLY